LSVQNQTCGDEQWVAIPGFEGHYLVSPEGRVRSMKRRNHDGSPIFVNWRKNTHGYAAVELWRDGKPKKRPVHALVAAAFLGPRPIGQEVRHLDGNRMNPHLANLAYGTRSENNLDKRAHGTDHNASKTHCPQGHPYDAANTRVIASRPGARYCRACDVLRGKGNPDRDWTRCPQGHVFDEANTYVDSKNKRHCRTCHRERQRNRYWERKGVNAPSE